MNEIDKKNFIGALKPIFISTTVGLVVCVVMLLLFSTIISVQNIPQMLIDPIANVCICVGSLVSGFLCAKKMRTKGLVWGTCCGVAMSAVILVATLGFSSANLGVSQLFKVIFIMICAMIGGIMGVNSKKRYKHKR